MSDKGPRWPSLLAATILFAILAIATYLRLHGLGVEPFWMDEGYTMAYTEPSFTRMLSYIAARDVHPPLYYIIIKVWRQFGDSEVFLRLPSAIFGIAAVGALWATVRENWGVLAAAASALLLATSEAAIWYSQEVRMYSLVLLLTVLSLRYFLRFVARFGRPSESSQGEPRPWKGDSLGLILANVALLYTHNVAVFIWVAQLIVGLAMVATAAARGKVTRADFLAGPFGQWLVAQAIVGLVYLPWFLVFVGQSSNVRARFWVGRPSAQTVRDVFSFALAWRSWMYPGAAVVVGITPIAIAVKVLLSPRDTRGIALAVAAGFPILASYLYSIYRVPMMVDRTLLFVSIPLLALVGSFVTLPRSGDHWAVKGAATLRVVVGLAIVAGLVNFNLKAWHLESEVVSKENFKAAAEGAAPYADGSTVFVFNNAASQAAFDYYFSRNAASRRTKEYGVPCNYLEVPEGNANLEPLVTDASIGELDAKLLGARRVVLVRSHQQYSDPGQLAIRYFSQSWQMQQNLSVQGVEVYVLSR